MCESSQVTPVIYLLNQGSSTWWALTVQIATILTPIVAIIFSCIFFIKNKHHVDINRINDQVDKAISIAMEYPYLEDKNYCNSWNGNYIGDDRKIRYYMYCCLIFNLISSLYELKRTRKKMNSILSFEEYVFDHRMWWKDEIPKSGGYSDEFIIFINNILKERNSESKYKSKPQKACTFIRINKRRSPFTNGKKRSRND